MRKVKINNYLLLVNLKEDEGIYILEMILEYENKCIESFEGAVAENFEEAKRIEDYMIENLVCPSHAVYILTEVFGK